MSRRVSRAESLADVRRELERIDRSIVLLLAARLEVAQRAIRLRIANSRRLTDAAQERRVMERGRDWAHELGVSEDLVTQLFRNLIKEGKTRFRAEETLDAPIVAVPIAAPAGVAPDLEGASGTPPASAPTDR